MNSTFGLTNTQSIRFSNIGIAWKVILGAACFFFYQFMIINMMNAMNVHLQQSLQINPKVLSIISSSYFFASLLSLMPAGILLDRYSTRKLVLLAMSISIFSTLLLAFATKPAVVLGARFLSGISGAFCFISCLRLATRWFPPEKFAQVIGVVVAMGMTGGILSQSPLSYLISLAGLKYAILTITAIGLILLYIVYKNVADQPPNYISQNTVLPPKNFRLILQSAISNKQNWLSGLYISLMNLPIFILGALWGSIYLVQSFGFSSVKAGMITSMIFVGMLLGSPCMGWLSDKLQMRKFPMILFAIILGFVLGALIYMPHLNYYKLLIIFFGIGFFCSAHTIAYSHIAESNSQSIIGTAEALASTLMLAGGLAQAPFAWILNSHWSGKMINGVSIYTTADFHSAISMIIAAIFGAALIALTLKGNCSSRVSYL